MAGVPMQTYDKYGSKCWPCFIAEHRFEKTFCEDENVWYTNGKRQHGYDEVSFEFSLKTKKDLFDR